MLIADGLFSNALGFVEMGHLLARAFASITAI